MTDYLGPLTIGSTGSVGTYSLLKWDVSQNDSEIQAAVEVYVRAASADAMAVATEVLVAHLRAGNTYVHSVPGVTYPVVYTIIAASDISTDENEGSLAFWQRVSCTLALAAMPAGALATLYSEEAVNAPASVSLEAMLGTNPPLPDVTIDDDSGYDMHVVIAALALSALDDDKWLVLADALTWTTMSSGSGSDMWGNVSRYTTSASYQTAPLDNALYPAGKYRLWVRAKQSAGTGYVKDAQNDVAVAVTGSTPHLVCIGDVDLPVADTAFGTAATLVLSAKSDGSNTLTINGFLLIPLDLGYFSWKHTTATTEIDQIDDGPSGQFQDGVTDYTYKLGGMLRPRVLAAHVGTLIDPASPTASDWPDGWDKTATGVSADTARFKCVGASKYAWFADTAIATPLVVAGVWYELSFVRDVDSYVAGAATAEIVWQDVDGNTVRADILSAVSADDAAPTAVTVYGKAPAHATRAMVRLGTSAAGDLTAYWSAVVLRRCPLRLIIVAEDADGALVSNAHPVKLTARYTPRYQIAR
jgi:hypothetical protein